MPKLRLLQYHTLYEEFSSLSAAYAVLSFRQQWQSYTLREIVKYNPCCRDLLRELGIEAYIARIICEVPELALDVHGLDNLRKWYEDSDGVAPYDIQCCGIHDRITLLGREFEGLEDVVRHCTHRINRFSRSGGRELQNPEAYPDIAICEVYDNYPKFDIYDCCDDRTYQNYFFRLGATFSADDMVRLAKLPCGMNLRMVHEHIPAELLPVLYYEGTGKCMLLATAKE